MKTIIRFPDGQQIIGEPESILEVIAVSQMYYVGELYKFFVDTIKGDYEGIEGFIESDGEHPKYKIEFSFDKKEDRDLYLLLNSKLYLEDHVKIVENLLTNAVKINHLSKKKFEAAMKSLKPVQVELDRINEMISKSS
ncbi:hypothetical protein [Neobacillus citreus]|uniref:Uncharacterized protein n=1 Tax=Neobacillus citreus TaxID=2833578 RepID=A0A942T821_9BACI|nr:hypothetical protein [Neobacillus citreus]MCH6265098.1 hypothetical protein [Neobacillus citreus]